MGNSDRGLRGWLRLSLALNLVLALAVAAGLAWKFTDVRKVFGEGSFEDNNWYAPYVYQSRELSCWEHADVVMGGDSLTMYGLWDEMLDGVSVANRGIGSDVAEGVLARTDTVTSLDPSKVFLMIGTNDISRGHDLSRTAELVGEILDELRRELPNTEVYLQSVLPRTSRYAEQVEELNSLYRGICEGREGVEYVDLYPLFCDGDGAPHQELFASDGYHMSGEGYALWLGQIRPYVYG